MFKKVLAYCAVAMLLTNISGLMKSADAAPHWKGPTLSGPENPFYPKAKRMAKKALKQTGKIDSKWDKIFRKYEGYSSANLK